MSKYKLLIGGKMIDAQNTMGVINPATEEVFTTCPDANQQDLDKAVASATAAFPAWAAKSFAERSKIIHKIADVIVANTAELAEILTLEQGKPMEQSTAEVGFAEAFLRFFADQTIESEVLSENDDQRIEIHRHPLGVVAGIMAWNFPLLISCYKMGPALIAGNTLILKPAPTTPLSTLRLGELIKDIVPAGVVNTLSDNNSIGTAISEHPGISKISFTGSTNTGKRIMADSAATLKHLTLELGGNDAAIVLDDVDPKQAAPGIFGASFLNSGQVCIALKRLYVPESIYDELCEEIAAMANASVVGNGMDSSSQFGPVQNKMQYDKVCNYVADAKANGRIIAGGDIPEGKGYFVPLTVVRDIEDGTAVVDEEPFGPILPIVKYTNLDDVINKANNSEFGLGASIWTNDLDKASNIASQLEAGTVWVNQHCAFGPNIPFPPTKSSGFGIEWGREGLLEFTGMKVVNMNKSLS